MHRTALATIALLMALAACSGSSPSPSEPEASSSASAAAASVPASEAPSEAAAASDSAIGTGIATVEITITGGERAGHYLTELTTGSCHLVGTSFSVNGGDPTGADAGDLEEVAVVLNDITNGAVSATTTDFKATFRFGGSLGELVIESTPSTPGYYANYETDLSHTASIEIGGRTDGETVEAFIDCHEMIVGA